MSRHSWCRNGDGLGRLVVEGIPGGEEEGAWESTDENVREGSGGTRLC